jgi:hypothetical protein
MNASTYHSTATEANTTGLTDPGQKVVTPGIPRLEAEISNPAAVSDLITLKVTISNISDPVIRTADFKYNKEVAFSFGFDDGLYQHYGHAFALFNGGKSHLNGKTYPGLKYSDGTGKMIAFRGTLVIPGTCFRADENDSKPYSISVREAKAMVNAGWGISNHSWKHGGGGPDYPNYYDRLRDVKLAESAIWKRLGVRPMVGTTPSNEQGFMYTFLNTGYLCHNSTTNEYNSEITKYGRMSSKDVPSTPFNLDRSYNGDSYSKSELAAKKTYIDEIFNASVNGNKEFGNEFTHGPGDADNFDAFYTYALKHPKNTSQNRLWVPSVPEFLEYFAVKRNSVIKKSISGNVLTINIDQSQVHHNIRNRDMSLLLTGMKLHAVTGASGANQVTFNPATGLINIYAINTAKVTDPALDVLPAQIIKVTASGNSIHVLFNKPIKQTLAGGYSIDGKKATILSGLGESWYINFNFPVKGKKMSYRSYDGNAVTQRTGLKVCDYIDFPVR